MARYDLRQLSSRDFEELVRDLLQAEWNVSLEAFRTGRDQGIDLRRVSANGGATIIQCKHFVASGYSKLLSLVSTVISLAHSLKLTVVAKGVELEEQAKILRLLRCDEMQGYLISKPLAFDAMTTYLGGNAS
jgi:predicted signal transduction protein with EAL and GGDEF domain